MLLVETCQHAVNDMSEMSDLFIVKVILMASVLSDLQVLVVPSVGDVEHVHQPQRGTKLHGIGQSNWPSLNQDQKHSGQSQLHQYSFIQRLT